MAIRHQALAQLSREATGEHFPLLIFEDQSFDAITCQFGIMFFPDKLQAMREAFRVLKPGGTFWFSVWDAIERNELALTAHTIVAKYFDDNPPDFYEVPFSFHDPSEIERLLATAGFTQIEVTPLAFTSNSSSAKDVARGLVHGNPIIASLRERCESRIPEIEADVESEVASRYGAAPVKAKMQALICSAVCD